MPEHTCATRRTLAPGDIPVDFLIFEGGLLRGILTDCAAPAPEPPGPASADWAAGTGPAQTAASSR